MAKKRISRRNLQKIKIWDAAQLILESGDLRAVPRLIKTLKQGKDFEERTAAAYTLGFLHDCRAIGVLLHTLERKDETSTVRGQAAEALGYLCMHRKEPRVITALVAALSDPRVEVRFWSAFALGEMGDAAAIPALKRAARNDKGILRGWWAVRKEARDAIRQIRSGLPVRQSRKRQKSTSEKKRVEK